MKRPIDDRILGIIAAVLLWSGIVIGGVAVVVTVWKMLGGVR